MPSRQLLFRTMRRFFVPWILAPFLIPVSVAFPARAPSHSRDAADPWTSAQTVSAVELATELKPSGHSAPLVINVGVRILYDGAHIPGAVYHGPGSSAEGIANLKAYAAKLPRNSDIVIYCGCCPLEKCPNIRPAFRALQEMGFTKLRVLLLPQSFATDWVDHGYPIQKGR